MEQYLENESRELAVIHKNDCNGSVRNLNGHSLWIYNWTPSNLIDGQYTTVMQVYERDWAEGRKEFGYTDLNHSTAQDDVVWGNATYQSDYIYSEPVDNDGRSTTAIDDGRKDDIWNNNGIWKGDYAGQVFMKIE